MTKPADQMTKREKALAVRAMVQRVAAALTAPPGDPRRNGKSRGRGH
ncbi:MAG: hypothetical protein PSX79_13310 [bacterium]|nr:hypothetical protein [bacterium]